MTKLLDVRIQFCQKKQIEEKDGSAGRQITIIISICIIVYNVLFITVNYATSIKTKYHGTCLKMGSEDNAFCSNRADILSKERC